MKKIMILMLSLAVLFAACDNSSTTPDNPAGEETTTVSDSVIRSAISSVKHAMADSGYGVAALLDKDNNLLAPSAEREVTFDENDVTKISVSATAAEAGEALAAETVKLDVTGINVSKKIANGVGSTNAREVALNTFTYTYSGNVLDGGKNVPFTATVNGFFADSAKASVYTENDTLNYKVAATNTDISVILPKTSAGITLVIDGTKVEDRIGYAFDQLVRMTLDTTTYPSATATLTTYAEYEKDQNDVFRGVADAYVKALLTIDNGGTTTTGILNNLSTWASAAGDPTKANPATATKWADNYSAEAKTVTFEVTASNNPMVVSGKATPGASDTAVAIAASKSMKVTFVVDTTGASPVAESYTISGDFVVGTYNTTSKVYEKWGDEFHVELSGDIEDDEGL